MRSGDRGLATVMFTDIVESTERAVRSRDSAWTAALERHDGLARQHVERHGGRTIRFMGDGFLATFDAPYDAVAAAFGLLDDLDELELSVRVGIHSGEVIWRDGDVSGITVHVASRICSAAPGGTVLTSNVVRELASGSELGFEEFGTVPLKGVPGSWRLHRVVELDGGEAVAGADEPPPAELPTVVLVDDHPLWRQSLAGLMERRRIGRVVAEAGAVEAAKAVVSKHEPDVVVMDVGLPDGSGIDLARHVVEQCPDTRVVMLSSSDERAQVLEAVRAGASGYLLKTNGTDEILDAVRRAHAGEVVFPPELSAMVLSELRSPATTRAGSGGIGELSDRELDVLELMARGRSNEAISEQLNVSSRTVESHVTSIYSKLDIPASADGNRRVQAVLAYVHEHGPLR